MKHTNTASKGFRAGDPAAPALRVVEEVAPVFQGTEYARIEPGKYSAQCVHVKVYRDPGFKRWTARLHFRLIGPGQEVCGFYNLGSREKSHAGRRSRYWKAWTLANGAPPRKGRKMTAQVFRGKIFLVEVSDVTQDSDGKLHHLSAIYSTVKDIIDKEVG